MDNSRLLVCAPFGIVSVRSPTVAYLTFNDVNREKYKWFHIMCQYSYQESIVGQLYNFPLDAEYTTSIRESNDMIPSDSYTIYINNNRALNRGTPNLLIKEVRIWPTKRSKADIANWRYRQARP